jgi:predicted ribosomally synthesized peptide with SipW-like signal peptide
MKTSFLIKSAQLVLVCLLLASSAHSYALWNQTVSTSDLTVRVNTFNKWFKSINPNTKLEARLNNNGQVRAHALEEIKVLQIANFSQMKPISLLTRIILSAAKMPMILN